MTTPAATRYETASAPVWHRALGEQREAQEPEHHRRGEACVVKVRGGVEHDGLEEAHGRDARARREEPGAAHGEIEMPEVHGEEREGGGPAHGEPPPASQRDGERGEHPDARERARGRAHAGDEAAEAEGRGHREQPRQGAAFVAVVAHRRRGDRDAEGHHTRDGERHQRLARVAEHPQREQRRPEQRPHRRGPLPQTIPRPRAISLRCNEFG
jgi:hypothetical protein